MATFQNLLCYLPALKLWPGSDKGVNRRGQVSSPWFPGDTGPTAAHPPVGSGLSGQLSGVRLLYGSPNSLDLSSPLPGAADGGPFVLHCTWRGKERMTFHDRHTHDPGREPGRV